MNAMRMRRSRLRLSVVVLAAGIAVFLPTAVADAAPGDRLPANSAEAAKLVEETAQQLTALDEQIHSAELTVAAEQRTADQAAARAAAARTAVAVYEPQLRAIAQSGFTSSSRPRIAAFLTSRSAADLVQQMATLDRIASHTEDVIGAVATAQDVAAKARADADAASARAQRDLAVLQGQKQDVQGRVASYQAAFNRLSSAEQAAVTEAVAGPTLPAPSGAQVSAMAPSDAAAAVLRAALAQVGKPYVWGAAGPGGYDCSGLTSAAYAAAGISLPHSAGAQAEMGRPVSRAALQPGDLVFFYSPVSHVGVYVGNGMMVHARTFGKPVAVTSVDQFGYVSARRLLG